MPEEKPNVVTAPAGEVVEVGEGFVRVAIPGNDALERLDLPDLETTSLLGSQVTFLPANERGERVVVVRAVPSEAGTFRVPACVIEAESGITLKCGESLLQLFPDGRIVIRGSHLLQRSTGPIRIKGASVDIN